MQRRRSLLNQSEHLMKFFSKYFTLLSTFTRSTAKWSFIVEKEKNSFKSSTLKISLTASLELKQVSRAPALELVRCCKRYFATHEAPEGGPLQSKLNQPWLSVHIIIPCMNNQGQNLSYPYGSRTIGSACS